MGLSRKHITEACHQALKRLQVDYLDLYFCHRPDPDTPISETVWAMHNLITQGKVLYWGTSEWSESEIREAYVFAHENNLVPPSMEQPQYNLLDKERFEVEYDSLYKDFGMGTTTWSPLASGALTGKYLDGIPANSRASLSGYEWLKKSMIESDRGQERMARVAKLKNYADDLGVNLAQLSIAWCLLNENVSTVILGASKASQLIDNLKCVDLLPIFSSEVQEKLRRLS